MKLSLLVIPLVAMVIGDSGFARDQDAKIFSILAITKTKEERNQIANAGIAIDKVYSDSVGFIGTEKEIKQLKALGFELKIADLSQRKRDFPSGDSSFHNYKEVGQALDAIVSQNPTMRSALVLEKA